MQCSIKLCLLHDIFLYSPQLTSRKYIDFLGEVKLLNISRLILLLKAYSFKHTILTFREKSKDILEII